MEYNLVKVSSLPHHSPNCLLLLRELWLRPAPPACPEAGGEAAGGVLAPLPGHNGQVQEGGRGIGGEEFVHQGAIGVLREARDGHRHRINNSAHNRNIVAIVVQKNIFFQKNVQLN